MKERQFKGLWIPVEVLSTPGLSAVDKMLWADIDSFTGNDSTWFKSNATVAEEFGVSERSVSRSLKNLTEAGLVRLKKNDGRTRYYVSTLPRQIGESGSPEPTGQHRQVGDIDNNREKQTRKQSRFMPPTSEEVKDYFFEVDGDVRKRVGDGVWTGVTDTEALKFYDYYTANGWTQGRGKQLKDWKAAARNWMRNQNKWNNERDNKTRGNVGQEFSPEAINKFIHQG